jgi:hypothetical protein
MSENTEAIQCSRWRRGQSGNPSGKPRGIRHQATPAAERLLGGEAEQLTRKCVEMALGGDTVALRLCLEQSSFLGTLAQFADEDPESVMLHLVQSAAPGWRRV